MAERALLHFVREGADQGVRSERPMIARTRNTGGEIGCDHVRHEAAIRLPTEDGADHCIGAQIGKHGEAHFGIRGQIARVAFDPTGTGAEADHAHDRTATGRVSAQGVQGLGREFPVDLALAGEGESEEGGSGSGSESGRGHGHGGRERRGRGIVLVHGR